MSLMQKTVTGAGLLPQVWKYTYSSPPVCAVAAPNTPPGTPGICTAQSLERKTVTVTAPDQNTTSYEFGTHAFLNDGKLLKTLYPDGSTQAVTYLDPANKAFPDPVGTSVVLRIDTDAATRLRPQEIKSEVRNGVTMTWQGANFDKFGSPGVRLLLAADGSFEGRTESLQARIDRINDRQEQMEARLVSTEKRLRAQYEALDRNMGQLSGLSSYMSQQLQALNNFYTARSGG